MSDCCEGGHKPFTCHCYLGFGTGCTKLLRYDLDDLDPVREPGCERTILPDRRQGWILTNTYQYTCPDCWTRIVGSKPTERLGISDE